MPILVPPYFRNSEQIWNWLTPGNNIPEEWSGNRGLSKDLSGVSGVKPSPISYPSSAGALSKTRVAAIDYLNADMAKHYKMGKASAYQEALANTSYQRAVADMKAAGLNPAVIFGAGRGAGASSSIYASSGLSGGSSGRRYYNQQEEKTFSSSEYSLFSTIGGLIGIALTGRPDGYWVGSQTTQGAMSLLDIINKGKSK